MRSSLKKGTAACPRVTVFRSLKNIYAQVIDDTTHATLVSCSSLELDKVSGDKKSVAHAVGMALGKKAKEKGIEKALFDRGSFLYHGRIRSVAEGLREAGLII